MDPLDHVSRTMQVLRERMSADLQRLGPAPSAPAAARAGGAAPSLRAGVAKRLKALDAADPRYLERTAQAFVEAVLLDEFGEALTNDANFRRLILEVGREMQADPDIAGRLAELAAELRRA